MTRRSPTLEERSTPCSCCNYPISQRHHLLDYAWYEENNFTWPLCGSCHDLYHLIENIARTGDSVNSPKTKAGKLLAQVASTKEGKTHFEYLLDVYNLAVMAHNEIQIMRDQLLQEAKNKAVEELRQEGYFVITPINTIITDLSAHLVDGDLLGKDALNILSDILEKGIVSNTLDRIKSLLTAVNREIIQIPDNGLIRAIRALRNRGYFVISPENLTNHKCPNCGVPQPKEEEIIILDNSVNQ